MNGTNEVVIVKQGCWESSPTTACHQNECTTNMTLSEKASALEKSKPHFCCCSSDYCNGNVTEILLEEVEEDENDLVKDHDEYTEMSSLNSLQTPITVIGNSCNSYML